jgi:MFS family permease
MYVVLAIIGIGWAAINVNSFPMVVEMSSGADVGKYTGIYYTFSMAAQISTPLLSGLIIDNSSFGYLTLFPYAVIFSALSFITMLFVKHGDSKPEKKKSLLENFDSED